MTANPIPAASSAEPCVIEVTEIFAVVDRLKDRARVLEIALSASCVEPALEVAAGEIEAELRELRDRLAAVIRGSRK